RITLVLIANIAAFSRFSAMFLWTIHILFRSRSQELYCLYICFTIALNLICIMFMFRIFFSKRKLNTRCFCLLNLFIFLFIFIYLGGVHLFDAFRKWVRFNFTFVTITFFLFISLMIFMFPFPVLFIGFSLISSIIFAHSFLIKTFSP
ncbi:hypothetical protein L9F63_023172, partial [Diploptera punctata]